MAPTRAQKTRAGRKNYGKNFERGICAEERAARSLRGAGWSVELSPGSRGRADLVARKAGVKKEIQVKEFRSRVIESPEVARRRAMSYPHNARRPGPRGEIWVYEKNGRRYVV